MFQEHRPSQPWVTDPRPPSPEGARQAWQSGTRSAAGGNAHRIPAERVVGTRITSLLGGTRAERAAGARRAGSPSRAPDRAETGPQGTSADRPRDRVGAR